MMIKYDLDVYINRVLIKQEEAKAQKKKQLLMQTAILLGKPENSNYSYVNFKRPLSSIPKDKLQTQLNIIVLTHCKKGVQVLNTNLEQLGLEIR